MYNDADTKFHKKSYLGALKYSRNHLIYMYSAYSNCTTSDASCSRSTLAKRDR